MFGFHMKPRCRQPRRSVILWSTFVVMVCFGCLARSVWKDLQCNNSDSVATLQQLCQQYYGGAVAGNMCPHLCDYRTVWFDTCTNYKGGKQALKADWMGDKIVLKSKFRDLEDSDMLEIEPALVEFISMITDSVHFNLPKKVTDKDQMATFKSLWMGDVDKYVYRKQGTNDEVSMMWRSGALNSLWSLVQQSEYLLSMVYSNFAHFPRIIGTCGHFYAVEYTPSGSDLSPGFLQVAGLSKHDWNSRARLALKFMKTMEAFERELDEPLHMCDMKGDNFGISPEGTVKAIDTDMAIFQTKLMSDLSFPNCSKHDDCSFFDCGGWCDLPKQTCTEHRLNNNWQSLCEKIFSPSSTNVFRGLLVSPPDKFSEISSLVRRCAHPSAPTDPLPGCTTEDGRMNCPQTDIKQLRFRAEPEIVVKLKSVLEASVETQI